MAAHIRYSMGLSLVDLAGYQQGSNAGEAAFLKGLSGNLAGKILRLLRVKYSVGVPDIFDCHQINFWVTKKIWHFVDARILFAIFKVEPIILEAQRFYCCFGTVSLSLVVLD
jgi:hypothetical protein